MPILDKNDPLPADTKYPNQARLLGYLIASRDNHVPALVVAEVVQAIDPGEQTMFQNPVGADVAPLLG